MPQKILIALDGSELSSKIVEFAAKTVSENSVITLFSVIPIVDLLCELDPPFIEGTNPDYRGATSFYEAVYHIIDPPPLPEGYFRPPSRHRGRG